MMALSFTSLLQAANILPHLRVGLLGSAVHQLYSTGCLEVMAHCTLTRMMPATSDSEFEVEGSLHTCFNLFLSSLYLLFVSSFPRQAIQFAQMLSTAILEVVVKTMMCLSCEYFTILHCPCNSIHINHILILHSGILVKP